MTHSHGYVGHPAAAAIIEQCISQGMPTAYHHDVVIDLQLLNEMPASQPFIWILREHGTHLIRFTDNLQRFRHNFVGQTRMFYLWNGKSLKTLAVDRPETEASPRLIPLLHVHLTEARLNWNKEEANA